mmetsp:Transcript_7176/g.19933  ORF Transcript_7176/g.19933 Transcript_7176/m.19933 type:complete len:212 (+) Transcript_7176:554-1189(+)
MPGAVLTVGDATAPARKPGCSSRGVLRSEGKSQIFRVLSLDAVSKRRGASNHRMVPTSSLCAWNAYEASPRSTSKTTTAPLANPAMISRDELAHATEVGALATATTAPTLRPQDPMLEDFTAHKVKPSFAAVKRVLVTASYSSAEIFEAPASTLPSGMVPSCRMGRTDVSQTMTRPFCRPVKRRFCAWQYRIDAVGAGVWTSHSIICRWRL